MARYSYVHVLAVLVLNGFNCISKESSAMKISENPLNKNSTRKAFLAYFSEMKYRKIFSNLIITLNSLKIFVKILDYILRLTQIISYFRTLSSYTSNNITNINFKDIIHSND